VGGLICSPLRCAAMLQGCQRLHDHHAH
jgi:hypothetical protein